MIPYHIHYHHRQHRRGHRWSRGCLVRASRLRRNYRRCFLPDAASLVVIFFTVVTLPHPSLHLTPLGESVTTMLERKTDDEDAMVNTEHLSLKQGDKDEKDDKVAVGLPAEQISRTVLISISPRRRSTS